MGRVNKISLYIVLIFLFLILSKNFSPSVQRSDYVENSAAFSEMFIGSFISVVLLRSFQRGFLIKTYYQQYNIIHGFKGPEMVTVRTSQRFWNDSIKNTGMSIFRRQEVGTLESTTPMPPGTLYIGDPAYGRFKRDNSGGKRWFFHRAYRHFPTLFYWGTFRPSYEFFKKMKIFQESQRPFYGLNGEFGNTGAVTQRYLLSAYHGDKSKERQTDWWQQFKQFLKFP
jgi:hypothetical protein